MRQTLVTALLLAATAPATGKAADVHFDLGFVSHYVWRGITLTEGPVFQPRLRLGDERGFALVVWGNVDLDDANDGAGDFNEIDLTLEYAWTPGRWDLALGLVEYTFPNTPFPGTRESYVRLRYGKVVSPRLEVYYDLDEVRGIYARFGLELEVDLPGFWSWNLDLSAGYADDRFAIGGEAGLHDGNAELAIAYRRPRFGVRLLAAYGDSLDDEVLLPQPVQFRGGVFLYLRR